MYSITVMLPDALNAFQIVTSTVLIGFVIVVMIRGRHPTRGVRALVLTMAAYSGWIFFNGLSGLWARVFHPTYLWGAFAGMFSVFVGWTVLNLGLRYPDREPGKRFRFVLNVTLALSLVFSGLCWADSWAINRRMEDGVQLVTRGVPFYVTSSWSFVLIFAGLLTLARNYSRESRPTERTQLLYCLYGMVAAVSMAFCFSFVLPVFGDEFQQYFGLGPSSGILFAFMLFVAATRGRLFDLHFLVRNTAILALLGTAVGTGLFLTIGTYARLRYDIPGSEAFGLFLVITLAAYAYFRQVHPAVERRFLGPLRNRERMLDDVLTVIRRRERAPENLVLGIARVFCTAFELDRTAVVLKRGSGFRFLHEPVERLSVEQRLEFADLILRNRRLVLSVADFVFASGEHLELDRRREESNHSKGPAMRRGRRSELVRVALKDFGYELAIPVMFEGSLLAIFFLGGKKRNSPYFHWEHRMLRTAANEMALVLRDRMDYDHVSRVRDMLMEKPGSELRGAEIPHRKISLNPERAIVFSGRSMEQVLAALERAAGVDENLLLLGETGTGKELAATFVHERSRRKAGPLIAINCGAVAESLLENELFGHERGAYTGADRMYQGVFEQAKGGTLFLDEIGEVSAALQVKLLRVLEERKITRLGGKSVAVDFRLVAATNRTLEELGAGEMFRSDLFHRLNVVRVQLPALRSRPEDIPSLGAYFGSQFAERLERAQPEFTEEAMDILVRHQWPGNVRELQNSILRAMIDTDGPLSGKSFADLVPDGPRHDAPEETLSRSVLAGSRASPPTMPEIMEGETYDAFLKRIEWLILSEALARANGNKAEAARSLGMNRTTFYYKLGLINESDPGSTGSSAAKRKKPR